MKVTYSADKKHAYFNGETFTRDERTGYYLTTKNNERAGRRLHRVVWEYYNGIIPKGYHVHHKDFDKGNNDISNLQLISSEEHKKLHGSELTDEEIEWRRNNIKINAHPKAAEWHKSEEGKNGTRSSLKRQKIGSCKRRFIFVNSAEKNLNRKIWAEIGSARINASRHGEERVELTMKQEHVRYAEKNLRSINIAKQKLAHENVRQLCGTCDALRYATSPLSMRRGNSA